MNLLARALAMSIGFVTVTSSFISRKGISKDIRLPLI